MNKSKVTRDDKAQYL